jgi:hypothetical protein|tara:strand:+ start:2047 stop:2373 length:327 start_codon:yes stop_codon:yes gene_type:complete
MSNTPYALCIESDIHCRITTCRSEGSANSLLNILQSSRPDIFAFYVSSEIPTTDLKDHDIDMYQDFHNILINPSAQRINKPKFVVIEGSLHGPGHSWVKKMFIDPYDK